MSQKLEDFEVLGIIGRGNSGTCYKVRNKFSKELYVWKAIDYGNLTEDHKQLLVSEVNLLRSLNHPNILKYCGRILHKETTTLYIITEWCEGGDLAGVIKKAKDNGTHLEEQFIWRMLYEIGRAIQVCHSRLRNFTIFHRDIKPANVFLDRHGNAKLGDFGLARIVQSEKEFSVTIVGTPYYMSPELVKGSKYNRKSDIWALGCLIYELCSLSPPFNGSSIPELADTIKSGKYKIIPSQYSENMKKVISFMLSTKHEFRPTIEMILHHPSVVMNIKSHREYELSKCSQSSRSGHEEGKEACHSLNSELLNLTLVDPELISNKVFKDKWAEKHDSLREREAWLKKREKSLGHKERYLANREKHLLLLERQAKLKQCLDSFQLLKKKRDTDVHDGHETDFSVEPAETPIRPTSAKLDPARLPRPKILTNACKKLEETNSINLKEINKQILENRGKHKEQLLVRRMLTLNRDIRKGQVEIKTDFDKIAKYKDNNFAVAHKKTHHHLVHEHKNKHPEVMRKRELRMGQEVNINHEIINKLSDLKQVSNQGGKFNKENVMHATKKTEKLKTNRPEHCINKANILAEFI